jgi:NHL repeat
MKWTNDYSAGGTCVVGCSNTPGARSDQLRYPRDLKFDQYGNLYVSDRDNHRVQKFMLNESSPNC